MKKLAVALIILALAIGAWMLFARGAPSYDEFKATEAKHKQPDELVPSNLESIREYKQDIFFFKRKYSASREAGLLADIKLDLASAEENLIILGNEFSKIDRRNPDCLEGGSISKSRNLLEGARKKIGMAQENSMLLGRDYPAFAEVSGVSKDEFGQSVAGISRSMDSIENIINSYC